MPSRLRPEAASAASLAVLAAMAIGIGGTLRAEAPGPMPAFAPADPLSEAGPAAVRAKLVADVRSVQPARPFRVGVLLEMEPGWHVYWRNPGDAGLATQVKFTVPRGFSVGPLRWPIPRRFEEPGDVTTFGYQKSVLLWAEVTPPRQPLRGSHVPIAASVSWLGCKERCVPGQAELARELSVADAARSDNAALFAAWRSRLPRRDGAAVSAEAAVPVAPAWGAIRIKLVWPLKAPDTVEWFPGPAEALEFGRVSVRTVGRTTRITVPARALAGQKLPAEGMESLVVCSAGGGLRRAVTVIVPLRPGPATQPARPIGAGPRYDVHTARSRERGNGLKQEPKSGTGAPT